MGRRARVVSKALLAAYGPPDCSDLAFSGSAGLRELQRILATGGQRLQQVKSLQLRQLGQGEECGAELVASIVAKLPHLESLKLPMADSELPLLAPLSSSLTALDAKVQGPPLGTGAVHLSQLTNLRSLALSGHVAGAAGDQVPWQHLLGSFPQLVRLSWGAEWNPRWLAGLVSAVPRLTSLSLGQAPAAQHVWDDQAAAAMRQALSGLRSLSWDAASAHDTAAVAAALEALAQCTWLEPLHLGLLVAGGNAPPNLLQLSSLRLASLHMTLWFLDAGPQLAGLHALTHLMKLQLTYYECSQGVAAPQLPSSLVDVQIRGHWNPSSLLPPLQALPSLRVLLLLHERTGRSVRWTPAAAEQLSTLTQLRSLSIATRRPQLLLPHLSALTALTALRLLGVCSSNHDVTDQDLVHLVPLQELTSLSLGQLQRVSASGLLALLEALPHLQRLVVASRLGPEEGGALVEGLLPRVLPRLNHLKLLGLQLPGHVRAALLSAAEAHDCRCVL
jgi:hypothetical protein